MDFRNIFVVFFNMEPASWVCCVESTNFKVIVISKMLTSCQKKYKKQLATNHILSMSKLAGRQFVTVITYLLLHTY